MHAGMIEEIQNGILSLDERAMAAKADKDVAEELLAEFQPFLRSQLSRYTTFIPQNERDAMHSVTMTAFYEAILSFDSEKGRFLPFAGRVVRLRLKDALRGLYAAKEKYVLQDAGDGDGEPLYSYEDARAYAEYQADLHNDDLSLEIQQFNADLDLWEISMEELVKQSPKHRKLRYEYDCIIEAVLADYSILQTILLKRYFPIKKIAEKTGFPQKKVERARTYLLACVIIATGDYDLLKQYIAGTSMRGKGAGII